jgi:outer membrane immunogenic protein
LEITVRYFVLSIAIVAACIVPAQGMELLADEADGTSHDWSGFYAGLTTGYGLANSTSTGVPSATVQNIGLGGAIVGGNLGFNNQFDNFVLGVEGDLSWSGLTGSAACVTAPALTCSGDVDWLATFGGRAGVVVDQALLYATAGLALSGVEARVTPPDPGSSGVYSAVGLGWSVGAGVEVAVTETVSLKAEVSHINLGSVQAPAGTVGAANAYDLTGSANVFKVGLNFGF